MMPRPFDSLQHRHYRPPKYDPDKLAQRPATAPRLGSAKRGNQRLSHIPDDIKRAALGEGGGARGGRGGGGAYGPILSSNQNLKYVV